MFETYDAMHGGDKFAPRRSLLLKDDAPGRGKLVIATTTLAGLLHPLSLDPPALFQSIKQWVERSNIEAQSTLRTGFDQLADLVAVAGTRLDKGEDQQLCTAFLEFAIEIGACRCHRLH